MFAAVTGGDLERDRPVGQSRLAGQIDAPTNALAEYGQDPEPAQRLSHGGKLRRYWGPRRRMTEDVFELLTPLGKPLHDFDGRAFLPGFLAQANFFINQPNDGIRLTAKFRMAREKLFGPGSLA